MHAGHRLAGYLRGMCLCARVSAGFVDFDRRPSSEFIQILTSQATAPWPSRAGACWPGTPSSSSSSLWSRASSVSCPTSTKTTSRRSWRQVNKAKHSVLGSLHRYLASGYLIEILSPCYVQINIQIFCEISYFMYGYLIFCMVCLFFKL